MSAIYYNGTILTMDDALPQVEAVLVDGDRIVWAGTEAEVFSRRQADTQLHDLDGTTMLPGFLDGHSHFAGVALSLTQCDLSRAESFADLVRLLRHFLEETAPAEGQWVTGVHYDHNVLAERRHPDKRVLDEVSQKHPIVLVHASSHMGVANSRALELLGIDDRVEDPAGGRYGRDVHGELNGYLEENAFLRVREQMPLPSMEELMDLFTKAQRIYAEQGITTVQEGMVTEPLFRILEFAREQGVLYLDLVGYADLENSPELVSEGDGLGGAYDRHFRIGGYKVFLDGSPQGRTAWMKQPYENAVDGDCGYPIKTDEELYGLILTSLTRGQQLLAHCNGDAAAEQFLTQFRKALQDHPRLTPHRPVMVHAQFAERDQLRRMKELSMMPSFFIAHTYYWGDAHLENLGEERAGRISPAGSAVRERLPFTFHQDSPVLPPNVLESIWCAVRRVTKSGVELDREERIGVLEALKANTVYGAYQYGEETEKGTIACGKLADLVILDRNPLETPIEELNAIQVMETIKAGKTVFQRELPAKTRKPC